MTKEELLYEACKRYVYKHSRGNSASYVGSFNVMPGQVPVKSTRLYGCEIEDLLQDMWMSIMYGHRKCSVKFREHWLDKKLATYAKLDTVKAIKACWKDGLWAWLAIEWSATVRSMMRKEHARELQEDGKEKMVAKFPSVSLEDAEQELVSDEAIDGLLTITDAIAKCSNSLLDTDIIMWRLDMKDIDDLVKTHKVSRRTIERKWIPLKQKLSNFITL